MKKTNIWSLALCALCSLFLVACAGNAGSQTVNDETAIQPTEVQPTSIHPTDVQPTSIQPMESDAVVKTMDGGTSMVNPLVKVGSFEELNKAVDVKMALPEDAGDMLFHVLDKDIAQVNFTVEGIKYTLRGTLRTEDIAGVYGDMKDMGTFAVTSKDMTTDVSVTSTNLASVYKWSWGKANYTLICGSAVTDTKIDVGTGKVAYACAIACIEE